MKAFGQAIATPGGSGRDGGQMVSIWEHYDEGYNVRPLNRTAIGGHVAPRPDDDWQEGIICIPVN